jgi:hypothetical protein
MNASLDQNGVPTLIAVDQTDGQTIVRINANPDIHALKVVDGTTGDDYGPSVANRDENSKPVLLAVSSVDGVTPVVVYADLDGNLLIDSN